MIDSKQTFIQSILDYPDKYHYVYFGLKAAPLTIAHERIIKYLYKEFVEKYPNVCLHIGVVNSEWSRFYTCNMVADFIRENYYSKFKKISWPDTIFCVKCQNQPILYDYLKHSNVYDPKYTLIVLGEDEWKHLEADDGVWKKTKELKDTYTYFHLAKDRNDEISATKAREIFFRDPDVDYFYIKDLISKWTYDWIKKHGTFWQLKPNYRAEENNFIEKYDPSAFERPSVTVDNIAWAEENGEKFVLLIRRGGHPYKGFWALPGGFLDMNDEDLKSAARRELFEETKLDTQNFSLETNQVKAYSDKGTDPRTRIVDVVFETKFSSFVLKSAVGSDDAAEAAIFNVDNLPRLAFNHKQIIEEFFNRK